MRNPRFFCEYKYNGNNFLLAGTSSAHLDAEFTVTDDAVDKIFDKVADQNSTINLKGLMNEKEG